MDEYLQILKERGLGFAIHWHPSTKTYTASIAVEQGGAAAPGGGRVEFAEPNEALHLALKNAAMLAMRRDRDE